MSCYSESTTFEYFQQIGNDFLVLWYVSHYLMYLNAALNPLIYGLTNENFRKAFRKISLSRLLCIPALASKRPSGGKGRSRGNKLGCGGKDAATPGVATIGGRLQPRAPCGTNEKMANLSSWIVCQTRRDNTPTSPSKDTKISQLKLTTDTMGGDSQTPRNTTIISDGFM
uniref:G-protein coupled receptors family 1 profile domain-containing protein n=1 Tax=Anopheles culicifacies TaxID=139723 RepID=A0A182MKN2_9DIPT